jgi:signal transduction histidine kinase
MGKIRHSLSLKLSLSVVLLAVVVFVVTLGVMFVQSRYMLRKDATERVTCLLDNTVLRVNNYMNTVETATNSNGWMAQEFLNPDSLLSFSHRVVLLNSHVSGCSITTEPDVFPQQEPFSAYSIREGDSIITVKEAAYDYYDQIWYKRPKNLARPCWTDPYSDYNANSLYVKDIIASYCKPLYSEDGRFVGVISTDLSFRRLKETIAEKQPYPNTFFALVNREGQFIIHPDSTKELNKTLFEDLDVETQPDLVALGHEMTTGAKGHMRVTLYGMSCLVCYQPVPDTRWCLALVIPDREILQTYYRLAYVIVPLIIIGLIVILLISRKIVARSTQPLNQLLAQTEALSLGNYEEQIPHTERADAIGQLQNSFATMQESLDRHVSQIRSANEDAKRSNDELVRATKLAENADRQKTLFIQDVTHQIRTPLNIIMGFAQVLRSSQGEIPHDEVKKIVDMVDHNAKILSRMLLMLYDSSDAAASDELQIDKNEMVSCNEVARESISVTREHFPAINVTLESDLPDSYRIRSNSLYIMRTLRELLYNAAKYSDGAVVLVKVQEADKTIRYIVEDRGPGMSESYYDLMFEPFTKVNELSEGLGLGLPLSKRHSQNLGGDLMLDTSYHDGCRFILELPKQ